MESENYEGGVENERERETERSGNETCARRGACKGHTQTFYNASSISLFAGYMSSLAHTHTHCDVEHIYGTYVRISIFVFIQQSRPEILCPSPMVAHYDFYDRLSSGGQRMERRVTH